VCLLLLIGLCVYLLLLIGLCVYLLLLTGRCAFIGVGFRDRADSFDLLVSIQDHFKYSWFCHC